jgi:hypothetical protein
MKNSKCQKCIKQKDDALATILKENPTYFVKGGKIFG